MTVTSADSRCTFDAQVPLWCRQEVAAVVGQILDDYPMAGPVKVGAGEFGEDMGSLAFANNAGFTLNLSVFNENRLEAFAKEWEGSMVDASLEGIVTHEMGHFLVKKAACAMPFAVFHDHAQRLTADNAFNASPYGQENASEAQAEAFVACRRGGTHAYPAGELRDKADRQANDLWAFIDRVMVRMVGQYDHLDGGTKRLSAPQSFVQLYDTKVGSTMLSYQIDTEHDQLKLCSIRTPQGRRGRGEASRALQFFVAMADALNMPATLDASPLDKRTRLDGLIRLYCRHGFETTGKVVNGATMHPVMARAPQSVPKLCSHPILDKCLTLNSCEAESRPRM